MAEGTNGGRERRCDYCGSTSGPLKRCSRCQKVYYCSVLCQRDDWNDGHRSKCKTVQQRRKQQHEAQQAWTELQGKLIQMSPQEAHEEIQKAQAHIRILGEKGEEEHEDPADSTDGGSSPQSCASARDDATRTVAVDVEGSSSENGRHELSRSDIPPLSRRVESDDDWTYIVEEIANLACFQVTLRPPKRRGSRMVEDLSDIQLSTKCMNENKTIVHVLRGNTELMHAILPTRLKVSSAEEESDSSLSVHNEGDVLCLRLPSKQESFGAEVSIPCSRVTSTEIVNSLQCRFCQQNLLPTEKEIIHRVLPLPAGHWDEVTDYLVCYNGQPAVDFSSAASSAQLGIAMEDESVVVLHRENLERAVCVLAVEAYGDDEQDDTETNDMARDSALFRGIRTWRDSVGGATACCSQCCAPLGFASVESPETFRLLKHRLVASIDGSPCQLRSCASFVANEMVRYAECKAIYTFVVLIRTDIPEARSKSLLLKLLNWDSRMAFSRDSRREGNGTIDVLDFQRVAKVVYEVSEELVLQDTTNEPMQWTWGGVDMCCLPESFQKNFAANVGNAPSIPSGSVASVRLWLSPDEWNEMTDELIAHAPPISEAVIDATLLVKLGKKRTTDASSVLGLSVLPL